MEKTSEFNPEGLPDLSPEQAGLREARRQALEHLMAVVAETPTIPLQEKGK